MSTGRKLQLMALCFNLIGLVFIVLYGAHSLNKAFLLFFACCMLVASALHVAALVALSPGKSEGRVCVTHLQHKPALKRITMKNKSDPKAALFRKYRVGARGFEPPTTTTPLWCATGLRYAPSA